MHRKSMNHIYRLIWSQVLNAWVPVAETGRGRSKGSARKLKLMAAVGWLLSVGLAQAAPVDGQVVTGAGSISQSGATTTIQQSSRSLALTWKSFNIAPQETVNFVQPSATAIAVNRIFDTQGTQILGRLNANGQVYLINPNGILFGQGAQVNVGSLVASTLDLNDASLSGNTRAFSGNGTGSIVNQGTINAAKGGYVALLGNTVSNQGTITAPQGSVALGAGSAATLTFQNNSLVQMQVDQSVLNSLAENGGLIRADGGMVVMNAGAKNALLASVVNNTGVIEARTVENHAGTIILLGGMTAGTVKVGGTLDASAPSGGNGGFIETSAAHVKVADDARVTTTAPLGKTGTWLIDPTDYTIAATGGNITGATLSSNLGGTNVTILSSSGSTAGAGNINVNDAVSWSANTLTLTAAKDININAVMTASGTSTLVMNTATTNGADAAVAGGSVKVGMNANGFTGRVDFPGRSGTGFLTINGAGYTVLNSLGDEGSVTGLDLQGINGSLAEHYALGSNIDASATSTWNSNAGFTPVGDLSTPFTGTFDGLGHTINNLIIVRATAANMGLFGSVGATGVVKNVGMVGADVTTRDRLGALAGSNYGAISDSYAEGTVSSGGRGGVGLGGLVGYNYSSGTINNSYASVEVRGDSGNIGAGGLVGYNYGTISNSYAKGIVTGGTRVGGLAGYNDVGTISNSYATGAVSGQGNVGGLVGLNLGSIVNSHATTGTVTGTSYGRGVSAGGLVGFNRGTISDSYAEGRVTGDSAVGGLVGYNSGNAIISNSRASGIVIGSSTVGGLAGFNGGTITGSYAEGAVTGIDSNNISTSVGGLVGSNSGGVSNSYATGGVLGSDYVGGLVGNNEGAISISYATGVVSGNHYVGGLVGYNYGTTNYSYATGTVTGSTYVGGLVGLNSGSVNNSYSMTGQVNGSDYIGGLVGSNSGGIINNSYATSTVTGGTYVGGLVGYSYGTLNNSYATGAVMGRDYVGGLVGNGGGISYSYSTGAVTGTRRVGGLVGYADDLDSVRNAHYNIDTVTINGALSHVTPYGLYNTQYRDWFNNAKVLSIANYASLPLINGYYQISTTQGLKDLLGFAHNPTYKFRLTTNLDLATISNDLTSNISGWHIPYFAGLEFDGAGHTLNNLTVNQPFNDRIGFIGETAYGQTAFGQLGNLGLTNVNVAGYNYVGGLVGNSRKSTINNSYATGTVMGRNEVGGLVGFNNNGSNISKSYATVAVAGIDEVGGLVGSNYGAISDSYTVGTVSGSNSVGGLVGYNDNSSGIINTSYAAVAVTGTGDSVGGLVGENSGGIINNSYATGAVSGSNYVGGLVGSNTYGDDTVNNTYAAGAVTGSGSEVGGLLGYNGGTINHNFWNSSVNATGIGSGTQAGATGMPTAPMRQQVNFTDATSANGGVAPGWDFANTWRIYDGHTYPLLQVFLRPFTITANSASQVYNGIPYSGGNGITCSSGACSDADSHLFNTAGFMGTSQGAKNVGSYTLISDIFSDQQGYNIRFMEGALAITPANLTLSGTRAYNATTLYAGSNLTATGVAGETFALTGSGDASNLTSKNVQTGSALASVTGLALGTGGGGGISTNYNAISTTGSSVSVTPRALSISATGTNKVYDGLTTDVVTLSDNRIAGDTLSAANSAANFDTKNVGTAKAVNVTGIAVTGTDAGNYTFNTRAATTANITQRSINVTADAKAKVYGNTDPALTFTAEANGTNRGLVGSDTFTGVLTRTAGESVGSYIINAAGLANGNYLITANNGVLTINPAAPILSPPALTPNPVIPPEAVLNATSQIQSAFTVFNPLEHHPTLLISPTINNREANPYLQEVVVVDNKETRIGIGGSGPTLRILSGGVTLLDNSVDVNEKDKP